jgi:very-short-patch-repair endonuclease
MVRHPVIKAAEIATMKFGSLRMKNPVDVTKGSAKVHTWVCDCGREKDMKAFYVLLDGTESCGRCNEISAEVLSQMKYGSLKMKTPDSTHPESHKKITWVCDCGNEKDIQARYVVGGTISSCGSCNQIDLTGKEFNKLRAKDSQKVLSGSNKKITWVCRCGTETDAQIVAVVSGRTRSCGRCFAVLKAKWDDNKEWVRSLKRPIQPEDLPDWLPKALEPVPAKKPNKFKAECRMCGRVYSPSWNGIRAGLSLSCGCTTNRVSSGQRQLFRFVQSLGIEVKEEAKVGRYFYDVFIPSHQLIIEYNGLKWHSKENRKKIDNRKYQQAISSGYQYIMIYEDEWEKNRDKVKSLIRNRLGLNKVESKRPSDCQVRQIPGKLADQFYEKYHYIGKTRAPINLAVEYLGQVIACMSFKKPSRQSDYDWELTRMAGHPDFRVHGIWNKLLASFVHSRNPKSIVSFSDNRLFTGQVYGKLGFSFDGDVRPDYYWVKGNKRHHKSTLRKTEVEKETGKTEVELRKEEGYKQIFDLGKKRWVKKFE